ncbi:MAG: glycosyltransferase family 4 protein [Anaeromyxobacter sp.]
MPTAAFFHDERFTLDRDGTWWSCGALPYRAFARYLAHFDRVVVVARMEPGDGRGRSLASGPGVEFACVPSGLALPRYAAALAARAREVLARADGAVVRMPGLAGVVGCREALRRGTPWMAEVVGDAFEALWNHGSWRGKAAAWPMLLLNRHYLARAPRSIYVTREHLQRRYRPRGEWVAASNVMIEPPRPEVLERRLARIAAAAPGQPFTFGLIGSYDVRYKGHATALEALARLRQAGIPAALRCIGVGEAAPWRARAAALGLAEQVTLAGPLPQGAGVLGWLDGLDACVAPSLTEGLPRALIEAMSRALPAVGSTAGGIPELLEPRWLHRPGDAAGLAERLALLARSPGTQAAAARRNWEAAANHAWPALEARRDALVRRFRAEVEARRAGAAGGARAPPGAAHQVPAR